MILWDDRSGCDNTMCLQSPFQAEGEGESCRQKGILLHCPCWSCSFLCQKEKRRCRMVAWRPIVPLWLALQQVGGGASHSRCSKAMHALVMIDEKFHYSAMWGGWGTVPTLQWPLLYFWSLHTIVAWVAHKTLGTCGFWRILTLFTLAVAQAGHSLTS